MSIPGGERPNPQSVETPRSEFRVVETPVPQPPQPVEGQSPSPRASIPEAHGQPAPSLQALQPEVLPIFDESDPGNPMSVFAMEMMRKKRRDEEERLNLSNQQVVGEGERNNLQQAA